MASENQGRHALLPDSAALWNGGEGFAFPLLHNETAHSGIRDSDPLSFLQMRVSSSPMVNFHGDPASYVGHTSEDSFSSMASNVNQANQLLMSSVFDPLFPGDVFPAESNHAMSFSDLNGMQCYDLNSNVQIHEAPSGIGSNLQLDINRSPINVGSELGGYGPDDWLMLGEPQLGTSKLDGSFLSLGYNGNASSTLKSYASAGDCNVSRLSLPPVKQEPCDGPLNTIDVGACDSLHSQNLVPSGNDGCLTLSHDDYGTLPGLTSGFDVSSSLPAPRQHSKVSQFMATTIGRSPVMGNVMNTRYTHPGSKAYQTVPFGLFSNSQSRISESGCSWMSSLPSEVVTTRSSQQSVAEENKGLRSNVVFPFKSPTVFPTSGTSCRKDQPDQVSQARSMRVPESESYTLPIVADQAASASVHNSNVTYKSSLKRGSSSVTNVTPRKMMRQHIVDPSRLNVQPVPLQRSVAKTTSVNPSISPTFTNISPLLLQQALASPVQTAPLQNTQGNIAPAFTPFAINRSSIDALPKTISAPQQSVIAKSTTRAYPSSSPTCTNITQPQLHPSLVAQVQAPRLQKMPAPTLQPFYLPSAVSPSHTAKLPNPVAIHPPSAATLLKAMPQPSNTLQNPLSRVAMGITSSSVKATRNRPIFNHTTQGSSSISGEKLPFSPAASLPSRKELSSLSAETASTARNRLALLQSSAVQRLVQSQIHALAAFEKKSPASAITSSSMPHIKWQASDKPEASGFKCSLCKRDLAYTPEGPVSIPAIAPEVAVLHCGHTFHDHCLTAITPQDQPTHPPCIPCSIGEVGA